MKSVSEADKKCDSFNASHCNALRRNWLSLTIPGAPTGGKNPNNSLTLKHLTVSDRMEAALRHDSEGTCEVESLWTCV